MTLLGGDSGLSQAEKTALIAACLASSGSSGPASHLDLVMPIVRRSPGRSWGDLVSIQPMTTPSSKLFYMNWHLEKYRWARPGDLPKPGTVVIGTGEGHGQPIAYFVVSVKNARADLRSGHTARSVAVCDIEPARSDT